ncbi:flagellar hook-associated protein FlgK [Rhodalgimonas zhirmunskyi]|uniref:Flagellar hook-associated protein 1 n=1 Tax=Rhodalgimonas zhirmunskyi TaxID=2964767 RepID=A0AAJ1U9Z3_9RHOB|nr:flagellar hook-associated protein FlgK [Rhodoalgimonas zhirmunskyi]MDQ2093963.1 flagellar hook-associated protein FlgK [Rhodoalgimonas zhirmunskyi]
MSLSSALSSAISGLTATSRNAQVTASNISNAMTEGYGRRELVVGSNSIGSGVQVLGVTRHVTPALLAERRDAAAEQAQTTLLSGFYNRLETLVGTPADGSSLSARMADFEASLVSAASRPDLDERLNGVVSDAKELAHTFKRVSDGIQSLRSEADLEIARTVEQLNSSLEQLRDLNRQISSAVVNKRETAALEDQRQIVIDSISEIVPIKQVPRELGQVALYTPGGAILIDGTAANIDFTNTRTIMPHMTQENGMLSGLEINGNPISTDSEAGPLSGGKLAALFAVRDDLAVKAQSQLDTAARDLVERFQDGGIDSTRAAGDAGFFTDSGAPFVATDEIGLSGRIAINTIVDPSAGGEVWHVRDGLGATAPGAIGNGQLLQDMQAALTALRIPASGSYGPSAQTASDLQASFLAEIGSAREVSDLNQNFASARWNSAQTMVLEEGVDTDQEIQQLMIIEQAYAANARMLEVIGDMMDQLARI